LYYINFIGKIEYNLEPYQEEFVYEISGKLNDDRKN
jgi:hypothetical protein